MTRRPIGVNDPVASTRTRSKNLALSVSAVAMLKAEQPMTLRQLYYRLVSAGYLQNAQKEYKRLGRLMTNLREAGTVPRTWIVDHVRSTLKPSSWSGLEDYGDVVRRCYRKYLWASMPYHVEVFVEKDAVAGTIQPVTQQYDISLHVVRGYSSVSFAGDVAAVWSEVEKPLFAYYLGDHDPSGFDIERDLIAKLCRYSGRAVYTLDRDEYATNPEPNEVYWTRLAVNRDDFDEHNLIRLPVKPKDNRSKSFLEQHGCDCAEVDALPPTELRQRVRGAIESHIEQDRWTALKNVERLEKETLLINIADLGKKKPNQGSVSVDGAEGDAR